MKRKFWSLCSLGGLLVASAGIAFLSVGGVQLRAQAPVAATIDTHDCTIVLKQEHEAVLASDRPGIVDFVEFEEGDFVEAKVEVARLNDEQARKAFEKQQEKATNDVHIRYAIKASEYADKVLEISMNANNRLPGTVPQNEIEKQQLEAQKGLLQVEQAQHEQKIAQLEVAEAEAILKTYSVTAPFAGVVSKVHLSKGEAVRQGDPIIEIISTARVNVEGYVTIPDSYRVKAGDKVIVNLEIREYDLPVEKEFVEGKVKFIDPRFSPVIGRVKLTAEVDNSKGHLKPGLNAHMVIIPAPDRQASRR